jgi:phage terminase large subunit-like protein
VTSGLPALRRLARASDALSRRIERDPLHSMRWLPSQHAFLASDARHRLLRTGNQLGKTTAGLAEVIGWCTGRHPLGKSTRPPPVEAWVLCASWSQSLSIQEKLWRLLPKGDLKPGTMWDPRNGFGGNQPSVVFQNGSIIRIKTTRQGPLQLAGATLDLVLCDEPPPQRVYSELVKRTQAKRGTVLITMTPINAPVDWIREAVEQGQIEDHHYRMVPENLIPVGSTRPMRLPGGDLCDADWIAEKVAETMDYEVPILIHGEWETRIEGRAFKAFVSDPNAENTHVARTIPNRDYKYVVGIDHGTGIDNQAAVLIAVDDSDPHDHPYVVVLDETPLLGRPTTSEHDAKEILAMLGRWQHDGHGLRWQDLAFAYGDIPARAGVATKGNRDLGNELAKLMHKSGGWRGLKPRIRTAKRGKGNLRGSIAAGERWIHSQMVRGRFQVYRGCEHLIECFDRYEGDKDSEYKHRIDATRYGLFRWVWGLNRRVVQRVHNG